MTTRPDPIVWLPPGQGPGGGGNPTNPDPGRDQCCMNGECSSSKSGCGDSILARVDIQCNCYRDPKDHVILEPSERYSTVRLSEDEMESGKTMSVVVWRTTQQRQFNWKDENLAIYVSGIVRPGFAEFTVDWKEILPSWDSFEFEYCPWGGENMRHTKMTAYVVLLCPGRRIWPSTTADVFDWGSFDPANTEAVHNYGILTSALYRDATGVEQYNLHGAMDYIDSPAYKPDCVLECVDTVVPGEEGCPYRYDWAHHYHDALPCCRCAEHSSGDCDIHFKFTEGVGKYGNVQVAGLRQAPGRVREYLNGENCEHVTPWGRFYRPDSMTIKSAPLGGLAGTTVHYVDYEHDEHTNLNERIPECFYVGQEKNFWNEPFGYRLKESGE